MAPKVQPQYCSAEQIKLVCARPTTVTSLAVMYTGKKGVQSALHTSAMRLQACSKTSMRSYEGKIVQGIVDKLISRGAHEIGEAGGRIWYKRSLETEKYALLQRQSHSSLGASELRDRGRREKVPAVSGGSRLGGSFVARRRSVAGRNWTLLGTEPRALGIS